MNSAEEERELIKRAKTDPEAFGELYEYYVERIYNYIYFRTGNVHDAEDLTGRVFFKALEAIGSYRDMGFPFSAWLFRIAHNQVANYHRDRSRKREFSIDDLAVADLSERRKSPEAAAILQQQREDLLKILKDLTPIKQEVIVLKFVEKLSNAEIGAVLNKSEGAIKSIYHRTLVELRERLDSDDFLWNPCAQGGEQMKNVEEENGSTVVKDLEERLEQQVYRVSPNPDFRSALKDHLKASHIYQRRREIGAIWVASLGLTLFLVLLGTVIYALVKPRDLPND